MNIFSWAASQWNPWSSIGPSAPGKASRGFSIPSQLRKDAESSNSAILGRDLNHPSQSIVGHRGHHLLTEDGVDVYDATGGAAVSCLGQGSKELHRRIREADDRQKAAASYVNSMCFGTSSTDAFTQWLINSTNGEMSRVYTCGSGSEATETVIKLSRQYFVEIGQPQRTMFISREQSYHGNTMGSLSLSGHKVRREMYLPLLSPNCKFVSSCNPYRQWQDGDIDETFVARKAVELEQMFQLLGPGKVIGFICEPTVGAALGCAPSVPGYLQAMKDVCHKYGALFILDEVMCGMGRTGTLHAWQGENVAPDISTVGKGLSGGFAALAAVLVNEKVVEAIRRGSGKFNHGHTYQFHPLHTATALEVQRYIEEHNLVSNVRAMGHYLGKLLHERLDSLPYVGDVRGKGLFWAVELVQNKEDRKSKAPFDRKLNVSETFRDVSLNKYKMTVYPGQGSAEDGLSGDFVIIAPIYTVTERDVEFIANNMETILKDMEEILSKARLSKSQ